MRVKQHQDGCRQDHARLKITQYGCCQIRRPTHRRGKAGPHGCRARVALAGPPPHRSGLTLPERGPGGRRRGAENGANKTALLPCPRVFKILGAYFIYFFWQSTFRPGVHDGAMGPRRAIGAAPRTGWNWPAEMISKSGSPAPGREARGKRARATIVQRHDDAIPQKWGVRAAGPRHHIRLCVAADRVRERCALRATQGALSWREGRPCRPSLPARGTGGRGVGFGGSCAAMLDQCRFRRAPAAPVFPACARPRSVRSPRRRRAGRP